jgi:uncharacterized protein YbjT (DUF2867 family)
VNEPLSRLLVTDATGYVGGRLVPRLLAAGYAVRCLVRAPEKLRDRPWNADPRVELRQGDLEDEAGLTDAMATPSVRLGRAPWARRPAR